jgi:hypothetical protein
LGTSNKKLTPHLIIFLKIYKKKKPEESSSSFSPSATVLTFLSHRFSTDQWWFFTTIDFYSFTVGISEKE